MGRQLWKEAIKDENHLGTKVVKNLHQRLWLLVRVQGLVMESRQVEEAIKLRHTLLLVKGCFRCLRCGDEVIVRQKEKNMIAPTKCGKCGGKKFKLVIEKSDFKDLGPLPLSQQPTLKQLKKEIEDKEHDIIYEVE